MRQRERIDNETSHEGKEKEGKKEKGREIENEGREKIFEFHHDHL